MSLKTPAPSLFPFLVHTPVRMAQVRRYATLPVLREENILEHSYMVALISYFLAKDFEADAGKAVCKSLFHDMEEAITGDICRDFKYLDPNFRWSLGAVEPIVMNSICDKLPSPIDIKAYEEWKDSKDNTIEGFIVEIADSIAVFVYIYEEFMKGNKFLMTDAWNLGYEVALTKLRGAEGTHRISKDCLAYTTIMEFGKWHREQTL